MTPPPPLSHSAMVIHTHRQTDCGISDDTTMMGLDWCRILRPHVHSLSVVFVYYFFFYFMPTREFCACAIMSTTATVPLVHFDSSSSPSDQFHELVYRTRRPAVLRGAPLGAAPSLWTPRYLAEKCGERPVKVHVSPVPQMDFIRKNFVYRRVQILTHRYLCRRIIYNNFYWCNCFPAQNTTIQRVCEACK